MPFGSALMTAFLAFFGVNVLNVHSIKYSIAKKILLSNMFLCGLTIFYGYQAQLTSALAFPDEQLPFDSPESLLKTNYR